MIKCLITSVMIYMDKAVYGNKTLVVFTILLV